MPGYLSALRRSQENRRRFNQPRSNTAAPSQEYLRAQRFVQAEKAAAVQQRISKVKSIFEARPDYVRPTGSVELQDWVAFGLVFSAALLLVHFFVGWWTILGSLIISVNGIFFFIEIQQSRVSVPGDNNFRLPPSIVHGVSIGLQTLLLFGYIWLPHWASILTQILLCLSAIFLLHKLRNQKEETVFRKRRN